MRRDLVQKILGNTPPILLALLIVLALPIYLIFMIFVPFKYWQKLP